MERLQMASPHMRCLWHIWIRGYCKKKFKAILKLIMSKEIWLGNLQFYIFIRAKLLRKYYNGILQCTRIVVSKWNGLSTVAWWGIQITNVDSELCVAAEGCVGLGQRWCAAKFQKCSIGVYRRLILSAVISSRYVQAIAWQSYRVRSTAKIVLLTQINIMWFHDWNVFKINLVWRHLYSTVTNNRNKKCIQYCIERFPVNILKKRSFLLIRKQ